MDYTITITCAHTRKLTEDQRYKLEREVTRALDEDADLPIGFDVQIVSVQEG